jgi:putative transposase
MTRAYSMDLRERVVNAVLSGSTVREAAVRFGIAVSTAVKWSQRQRATGSVAPGKMGGHRRPILREQARIFIAGRIAEKPDLTVRTLQAELLGQGLKVSHDTVWKCLKAEELSCKKNRVRPRAAAPQDGALSCPLEGTPAQD